MVIKGKELISEPTLSDLLATSDIMITINEVRRYLKTIFII